MKGHTRKRGSTWSYQFSYGSGKNRKHVQRSGFRIKQDAEAALAEALAAFGKGDTRVTTLPSAEPLGVYLTNWLDARADLKPSTVRGYRSVVKRFIEPQIGKVALRDLTSTRIAAAYAAMRKSGGRRGTGLSDRSVQLAHAVLRSGLQHAVEQGHLTTNPASALPRSARPHVRNRREMKVWTAQEAATFLAETSTSRWGPLWATALDSGLRRGELLGLRWQDVDLESGRIAVRRNRVAVQGEVVEGTPKSGKARTVDLSNGTVARLKKWRSRQREERLAWGEGYSDSGYVFTAEDGTPARPEAVAWQFRKARASASTPEIRFHDLRHTSATLDLEAGIHPKVVQERLGHATIAMTLDLYSHVTPGMGRDAAKLRGGRLYGTAAGS